MMNIRHFMTLIKLLRLSKKSIRLISVEKIPGNDVFFGGLQGRLI